jgi:hypothetical protein
MWIKLHFIVPEPFFAVLAPVIVSSYDPHHGRKRKLMSADPSCLLRFCYRLSRKEDRAYMSKYIAFCFLKGLSDLFWVVIRVEVV